MNIDCFWQFSFSHHTKPEEFMIVWIVWEDSSITIKALRTDICEKFSIYNAEQW